MELDSDFLNDDLSSAMGTDTLVTNDMVQEGFQASSGKRSDLPIIHGINQVRSNIRVSFDLIDVDSDLN
jgi:hypothetical protein